MMNTFLKPASAEEAAALKQKYSGSIYFGGGTEINYAGSLTQSECVIGLQALGLNAIEQDGDMVSIGASATAQELIDSPLVPEVLQEAAGYIYSRNIRNIATLGGNIGANTTDSALLPCLIALSAEVNTSEDGLISVEEYLSGGKQSLILSVRIPLQKWVCAVKKISRTVSSVSVINVAVRIDGTWEDVREAVIAVGGVAPRVVRLASIEAGLASGGLKDGDELQKAVSEAVSPQSDILGSMSYKQYICGVVVADCVSVCMHEGGRP